MRHNSMYGYENNRNSPVSQDSPQLMSLLRNRLRPRIARIVTEEYQKRVSENHSLQSYWLVVKPSEQSRSTIDKFPSRMVFGNCRLLQESIYQQSTFQNQTPTCLVTSNVKNTVERPTMAKVKCNLKQFCHKNVCFVLHLIREIL